MTKRWMTGAALVVALAWGAAAPAGATGASAALRAKLLSAAVMPKGFLKEATSSVEVFGCSGSAFPVGASATASISFNYRAPKAFPLVTEEVGSFTSITSGYGALTNGLSACPTVSGTAHGSTFTGTIAKVAYKAYPDESEAFNARITLGTTVLVDDILIVRRGNLVMDLQEANTNSLSAAAFRSVVTAAVRKL